MANDGSFGTRPETPRTAGGDGAPPGILTRWDAELRCRAANGAAEAWFGIPAAGLRGRHLCELLGPRFDELRGALDAALQGCAQTLACAIPDPGGGAPRPALVCVAPDPSAAETPGLIAIITAAATVMPVAPATSPDASPLRPLPARPLGTPAIARLADSAERRRLEHELALAEAMSSGILSISSDAIISIDAEQRITRFNEGAATIFGYRPDEVLGAPLELLIPQRFRAAHRAAVQRFATGPVSARRMVERPSAIFARRKDGEEFPVDAAISRLEIGGSIVMTVVLRDITEATRVEREQRFLAEVGAALASTLEVERILTRIAELAVREVADFCVVDLLEDGADTLRRLEVACRDGALAPIAAALQQVPLERSHPQVLWRVLATRQTVLRDRSADDLCDILGQDEAHRQILRAMGLQAALVVPMLARGTLFGAIALLSTSGERRYGPADARFAEEFARRAALSIANARLYEEARRAAKVRDEVLGIVAHDLRNPLHNILLQAGLLQRSAGGATTDEAARRAAALIERAARRGARLIQDLVDVTRMDGGRLSIDPAWLSPEELLHELLDSQGALARASQVELRLELAGPLPRLWADHDRLLQVFENLVGNALKFTGPGGTIALGAQSNGVHLRFWVRDTGVGIPPDEVPLLFERFWQGAHARTQGAGLGLLIVKALVEAHGGRIWVETAEGQGTTVFFTVPLGDAAMAH